jgi:predicted GTPase
MKRFHLLAVYWREALLGLIFVSPWLSLLVFGVLWLHRENALLPWLAGAAILGFAAWPLRRSIRHRRKRRLDREAEHILRPSPEWGERARQAWEKVQAFAAQQPPLSFTEIDPMQKLGWQTVQLVAVHFHEGADRPELDVTVPEILLLAEQVARDLRVAILGNVPGARSIKVRRLFGARSWIETYWPWAKKIYRAGDAFLSLYVASHDPVTGATRALKGKSYDKIFDVMLFRLQNYVTAQLISEIGRAAIDLYCGKLRLSADELEKAAQADARAVAKPTNPLPRVLVVGQPNAGKSSLINALAGDVVCEVQAVPTPAKTVEHILSEEGEPCVSIVDMPGLTSADGALENLLEAAQGCDMMIWVASAVQPARSVDAEALAALRKVHATNLDIRQPPLLLALTHVDQLSPAAQWDPPYNVVEPQRPKESAARRAMESAARTLGIPLGDIVPVAMPAGAEPWNTELLWGHIIARSDEAKSRQLSRLRLSHAGFSWQELAAQAIGLGSHLLAAWRP